MPWKTNYLLLSEKLIQHLVEVKTTTFDRLEARALKHGINMNVFDQAIATIHKLPQVKRSVVNGTVKYELQEVKPKVKTTPDHVKWCKDNYIYPVKCLTCNGLLCANCFPFYDPDKDTLAKIRERLFMTRDEYKAKTAGREYVKKRYYGK